jgi:four helix bundle protein
MVKAADSIGANIAEGTGRGSFQDNRRFVRTARGSLYETRHWLRRAYTRDLLTSEQVEIMKPLVDNLAPMLNAYLKSIGKLRGKDT